jgi:hypothetical protein
VDWVIYGIVIVQEPFLKRGKNRGKADDLKDGNTRCWIFGRVSDLNVNLWGFHFQTHTHIQKKRRRNVQPPFFRLLLRAFVTSHPKKTESPQLGGVVSTIYSIHFYDDTIFFSLKVYNKVGRARWNLGIWFLLLNFFFLAFYIGCSVCWRGCKSRWFKRIHTNCIWKERERGMIVRLFKCSRAKRRTTCATGCSRRPNFSVKREGGS